MPNVILFGESGSGKSSLVNMIVGNDVAKVANLAIGCTIENKAYHAIIDNTPFTIYDTSGLNEGDHGRIPHWMAIQELYLLIRHLDGVSLLIYCMREWISRTHAKANWTLFNKVVCGGKVPTIVVVTGLEVLHDPDDWWNEDNQNAFKRNGINPEAVGCVVSFRGRRCEYERLYNQSQVKLRNLIRKHSLRKPWYEEKERWFANIYEETSSSFLGFVTSPRLDYTAKMRDQFTEFVRETGMTQEDSEKLEAALLSAEKRFRKRSKPTAKIRVRHASPVPGPNSLMPNIILFGESGSGKSSLVNMIVGQPVAVVSNSAKGCTSENNAYDATIGNTTYKIYDTAGLEEGDQGSVPHWKAIRELYTLIRKLDSVSLLICCMRGRVKKDAKANWILFNRIVCAEKVPNIVVVTGMETCQKPSELKEKEEEFGSAYKAEGMEPTAVGCVVSYKRNEHAELYNHSQAKLRDLITKHTLRQPWSEEKEQWFASIYDKAFSSFLCSLTSKLDYTAKMRNLIAELVRETGMTLEDSEKLEATLLNAEKRFRKRY